MKKLLAVDGNSILNRAFYGIRPLNAGDGLPTNAIYGMLNILHARLSQVEPDYAAVAFDVKAPTFRHKEYTEYKAGRHAAPDDLLAQMPWAKKCCEAMGMKVLELPGWEADDILGTLAAMAEDEEVETYILTGDRDSLQLISDTTKILLATNNDTITFDRAAFNEKYGLEPEVFVDVKALMGDSSDNIPGVPGIGEKTALKLIGEYHDLDGLFEKFEDSALTAGVKNKLRAGKESAYLSQFLARIDRAAPIEKTLAELEWHGYLSDELTPLLIRLGFSAFLKKMAETTEAPAAVEESAEELCDITALAGKRAAVYFDGDEVYASNGEKTYVTTLEGIMPLLCDEGAEIALFDLKSTLHALSAKGIGIAARVFDCSLCAYVLNAQTNTASLDALTLFFLEQSCADSPARAAKLLYMLAELLDGRLEGEERRLYEEIELPLAYLLFEMEKQGFLVDRRGLAEYSDVLSGEAKRLEAEIFDLAGQDFNINSPKQLASVLFDPDKLGLPCFKKTKSGYSTNAEVLEKLRPYHPIIDKILYYRQLVKLNSTYAVGLLNVADENGRVHTTFNQTVTATGRLSSAEPNLQNIPIRTELGRELRRFFTVREGYTLIDADYSQIELRLLAAISGDETMLGAFRDGIDIHTLTASQVFRVFPEAVTSELRKRAKAVNFGIVYGIGDFSLAQDIGVTKREAGEYIRSYLDTYPAIDAYLKNTVALAHEQGYVTTLLGRKRYIPELSSSKKTLISFGERVAMNSPIQGTAADIIKLAMINTARALREAELDARLILQVHDELLVEARHDHAEQAMEILRREMENAYEMRVPLSVEIASGKTWYDAH